MIDEADARLRRWIADTVGAATPVSMAPPGAGGFARGVGCYLLDLVPAPPERSARRPPLQIALRYLLTTWDEDPVAAHRVLGQLAFAALADDTLDVERDSVPVEMWRALGVAPRPAVVMRVPLRVARPEHLAPRVRQPMQIDHVATMPLAGVVLGPGDVPIVNARVQVVGLDAAAVTDRTGRFRLATVPSGGPPLRVRVEAHGVQVVVVRAADDGIGDPMKIRFPIPEG